MSAEFTTFAACSSEIDWASSLSLSRYDPCPSQFPFATVCAIDALRIRFCASASVGFVLRISSAIFSASAGLPAPSHASPSASRLARLAGSISRTASSANATVSGNPSPAAASASIFSAATLFGSFASIASALSNCFAGSFLPPPNMNGAVENPLIVFDMKPDFPFETLSWATRWSFRTGRHPGAIFKTCAVTSRA